MGIVPEDAVLSDLEPQIEAPSGNAQQRAMFGPGEVGFALDWDELTEEQQAFQAMKMRIHAAMIDRMDQEIGRVLDQLREMDAFDNTLIVFLSDNGASAEIMVRGDGHDRESRPGAWDTYLCLGPGWSSASNTPFRRHKIWTHEGGIATPAIFHWPDGIQTPGELRHFTGHIIDLAPTLLHLADVQPPWLEAGVPRAPGAALTPLFGEFDETQQRGGTLFFNHAGNRALRAGNWKIVSSRIDRDEWELYDLSVDRAEQHNLAEQHPQIMGDMVRTWQQMHERFQRDASR